MHSRSWILMRRLLSKYALSYMHSPKLKVLEIGSHNVSKCQSYRSIIGYYPNVVYHGLDLDQGENVDICTENPYAWPIENESYDIVISGQCLEHVEAPWRWIKEVYRVVKPGGLVVIIAPWACGEHRFPVDCWRILPDGMKFLLRDVGLNVIEVGKNDLTEKEHIGDTWGVAKKIRKE